MAVGSSRRKKPKRPSSDLLPPPPMSSSSSSSASQSRIKTSKNRNHLRKRSSFLVALVAFSLLLFLVYTKSEKKIAYPIESDSRFYTFEIVNEFPHDPNAFTQVLTIPFTWFNLAIYDLGFEEPFRFNWNPRILILNAVRLVETIKFVMETTLSPLNFYLQDKTWKM